MVSLLFCVFNRKRLFIMNISRLCPTQPNPTQQRQGLLFANPQIEEAFVTKYTAWLESLTGLNKQEIGNKIAPLNRDLLVSKPRLCENLEAFFSFGIDLFVRHGGESAPSTRFTNVTSISELDRNHFSVLASPSIPLLEARDLGSGIRLYSTIPKLNSFDNSTSEQIAQLKTPSNANLSGKAPEVLAMLQKSRIILDLFWKKLAMPTNLIIQETGLGA
jgi:hypothetical protein